MHRVQDTCDPCRWSLLENTKFKRELLLLSHFFSLLCISAHLAIPQSLPLPNKNTMVLAHFIRTTGVRNSDVGLPARLSHPCNTNDVFYFFFFPRKVSEVEREGRRLYVTTVQVEQCTGICHLSRWCVLSSCYFAVYQSVYFLATISQAYYSNHTQLRNPSGMTGCWSSSLPFFFFQVHL